jgi:hypothetical protein
MSSPRQAWQLRSVTLRNGAKMDDPPRDIADKCANAEAPALKPGLY